jgi:hypothetical protein
MGDSNENYLIFGLSDSSTVRRETATNQTSLDVTERGPGTV